MTITHLHTADDLLAMPGADLTELIEGELFEVSPTSFNSSVIAGRIFLAVGTFVDEHDLGYVTVADGGYLLERNPDSVVAPDVAFVRGDRLAQGYPRRGYAPLRPDLAVEVRSPTDEPRHIRTKQALYERIGIPLAWWVDPDAQTVTVREPGQAPVVVDRTGVLDGGEVLPGFRLPLATIFRL
jgi:Uma2 family endonuclease